MQTRTPDDTMRITMIAAALPPQLDGIGDYTAHLAAELAQADCVSVLTCEGQPHSPIPGVRIVPAFLPDVPQSCRALTTPAQAESPDWVVLQYNPFAYGKWGCNLYLPRVMAQIKRQLPHARLAVMVHEPFVPIINVKFAVMASWQRRQLWQLGRLADVLCFSIDPWAQRFRRWFPSTPIHHLPVGSNIPHVALSREEARRRLAIPEKAVVLGLFGTAHASRLLPYVRGAAATLRASGREVQALYMGPHGQVVREALGDTPLIADGPLAAEEISRRFAAVDINLAPYSDGISTRRTTLMTALQHGVATVGTRGCHTDAMLLEQEGTAFLLADANAPEAFSAHVVRLVDAPERRRQVGRNARQLYTEHFAWDRIAATFRKHLSESEQR